MKAMLAFILCVLCFGSIGILKSYAHGVPSPILAFARLVVALAALLIFFEGKLPKPRGRNMWRSLALSGLFIAVAFTLYLEAFNHASIADVSLLGFVDPLFVTMLAGIVLHEKITLKAYAAFALAAMGVFLLLGPLAHLGELNIGIALALLAFLAGGANTLLSRLEEKKSAPVAEVVFYPFAFAALFLVVPSIAMAGDMPALGAEGFWAIIGLGVATAAGYFLFDFLMEEYGAHVTDLGVRAGITVAASAGAFILLGQGIGENWLPASALLFGAACLIYLEAQKKGKKFARLHGHTH